MQFLQCLFSPRLYKVYRKGSRDVLYEPKALEGWGDLVICMATSIYNIGYYSSPFIFWYLYKKGYFIMEENKGPALGILCLTGIMMLSFVLRGMGRARNPTYMEFLTALNKPTVDIKEYLKEIRNYDFDFKAWPMTYSVQRSVAKSAPPIAASRPLRQAPTRALAWLAVRTFGLRMIYPGTISLIHNMMYNSLINGRTELVEEYNGQRTKIRTGDGNTIDTMFIDNRRIGRHGEYLVICCEGNMGFYELGMMSIPAKAGCSVIGWNHPGFCTSTGMPYPSQERKAVDAVVQFALEQLGFDPAAIVMYGWSIGGYTAAWAASSFPDIGGLILDATFSDILPLAKKQMPTSIEPIVTEVIRSHVNLNVVELVDKYTGPIYIIRRTEDEIISLVHGQVSTNCINELVLRVIAARHPAEWAALGEPLKALLGTAGSKRAALLRALGVQRTAPALQLLDRYLRDYRGSHCSPLPMAEFETALRRITAEPQRE